MVCACCTAVARLRRLARGGRDVVAAPRSAKSKDAVNVGRILRIRPGASTYEDFFTPPPGPDNNTCVGCHTLSRDGSKMAFEYSFCAASLGLAAKSSGSMLRQYRC